MCFFSGSRQQPDRSLTMSAASVRDIHLCRALGTRAGAVPIGARLLVSKLGLRGCIRTDRPLDPVLKDVALAPYLLF